MLLELRLKRIRLKQKKRLNKTNFYLYESITSYIQNSDLRRIEKEEILQQIIDMMLQVQLENKSMNLIIGNDYEEFCKSIIREYNGSKSKIYRILNYIQGYFLWTVLILLSIIIFRGITTNLEITIDDLIMANIISLVIIPNTKKNRRGIISITPWHQRFSIMNKGLVTFGILFIIWRRFIYRICPDPRIFNYRISYLIIMLYLVLMLIIMIAIEIYKRIYDNLK